MSVPAIFGAAVAVGFWVTLAVLCTYGLFVGNVRPWIEERLWRRDERRGARELDRRSEIQRRLSAFELAVDEFNETFAMCFPSLVERDPLEDLYSLPCAPDPRRIS